LVEQSPLKRTVVGSIPTGRTSKNFSFYAVRPSKARALRVGQKIFLASLKNLSDMISVMQKSELKGFSLISQELFL